jgi:hypothetical protein
MHLLGEFDRLSVGNIFSEGTQMNYVGIDHHRQYSHITWLDEKGEVVKSGRVGNLRRELEEFLQGVSFARERGKDGGGAAEDLSSSRGAHQRDKRFSPRVV